MVTSDAGSDASVGKHKRRLPEGRRLLCLFEPESVRAQCPVEVDPLEEPDRFHASSPKLSGDC